MILPGAPIGGSAQALNLTAVRVSQRIGLQVDRVDVTVEIGGGERRRARTAAAGLLGIGMPLQQSTAGGRGLGLGLRGLALMLGVRGGGVEARQLHLDLAGCSQTHGLALAGSVPERMRQQQRAAGQHEQVGSDGCRERSRADPAPNHSR